VTAWTISLPHYPATLLTMNDRNASTPLAAVVPSPGRKELVPSGRFLVHSTGLARCSAPRTRGAQKSMQSPHEMETQAVYALAVTAAAISTVALLVMVSLTAFVVSLAFRARRTPDSSTKARPTGRRRSLTTLEATAPEPCTLDSLPQVRIAAHKAPD
jgi:hypothetical protein